MTENYHQSTPISTDLDFDTSTYVSSTTTVDPTFDYQSLKDLKDADGHEENGLETEIPSEEPAASISVAEAIATMLVDLGIKTAFGVPGGAMASVWGALCNSSMEIIHCRHESGAAFSAVEAYFATNRPVVVFTTAGPGITNALTGLLAGRGEGAKVILISACTSAAQRGKWAIQETSTQTIPQAGIFTSGTLFNYATTVEVADQLPQISRRLALGLSQPGGYIAHLTIPTGVQTTCLVTPMPQTDLSHSLTTSSEETISKCVELLTEGPFAIWVGFGARGAAEEIRTLAERTGAAVMCSPRGKGIFPEDHPQYIGVTGLGGHASVTKYMQEQPPLRTLVLGTRLGEPTCFWNQAMVPVGGFIHVDIDPDVPGVAYPSAETFPIQSDVGMFLQALLKQIPESAELKTPSLPRPEKMTIEPGTSELVRPEVLLNAIQRVFVEGSDAIIMAESGNSFTWATNLLRIDKPNRYRVSTGVGSMGHMVGDGAMLMNNEINTAVKYHIPAVWIILNDARYNMCEQGMKMLGMQGADAQIPETDFVLVARGMGADGIRVESEADIETALEKALASPGPFIVDVIIDPSRFAPSGARNKGLKAQKAKSSLVKEQVSFPMV